MHPRVIALPAARKSPPCREPVRPCDPPPSAKRLDPGGGSRLRALDRETRRRRADARDARECRQRSPASVIARRPSPRARSPWPADGRRATTWRPPECRVACQGQLAMRLGANAGLAADARSCAYARPTRCPHPAERHVDRAPRDRALAVPPGSHRTAPESRGRARSHQPHPYAHVPQHHQTPRRLRLRGRARSRGQRNADPKVPLQSQSHQP